MESNTVMTIGLKDYQKRVVYQVERMSDSSLIFRGFVNILDGEDLVYSQQLISKPYAQVALPDKTNDDILADAITEADSYLTEDVLAMIEKKYQDYLDAMARGLY
jgi:hypothetical protein